MGVLHIVSASEFLKLLNEPTHGNTAKLRSCTAGDAVWFELIEHNLATAFAVAKNNTISTTVMKKLADYPHRDVRIAIAMKHRLCEAPVLFEVFANDEDMGIRACIATRHDIPSDLRERLEKEWLD